MQREMYQRQQQEMMQKFEEDHGQYEEYSDEMEELSSNDESHSLIQNVIEEVYNEKINLKKGANNKELQNMLFR